MLGLIFTKPNNSYDVDVYDIDLFDSSAAFIQGLHDAGRYVVCNLSAGSYEDWRPDAGDITSADLGNSLDGWPGERWLDIRSANVRNIMADRLDLAAQKGCDGVEPDNGDGYSNATGLPLTAEDQLDYNRFLAQQAHQHHLAVALKNDVDQAAAMLRAPFLDCTAEMKALRPLLKSLNARSLCI